MPSDCDGTYLLQEYTIPRNSASFCLYDTRGLLDRISDNDLMLRLWLKEGVCHGEVVIRWFWACYCNDTFIVSLIIPRSFNHNVEQICSCGIRNTDDLNLRKRLQKRTCHSHRLHKKRKVNFVIFVVNGASVLKEMDDEGAGTDQNYNKVAASAFSNTYLSFRG